MNVVIRTDASIGIGTGHVMRCLTLAKQLKRHGVEVTFICREFEGNSISYLRSQGVRITSLPSVEKKVHDVQWTRDNWKLDAQETKAIIKEMNNVIDLIIVDHYGLDSRWESTFRLFAKQIMVIDDLADRSHDCDLLLDQNYYLNMNERYAGLVPNHCLQMLGPNYVLLRDEFLQVANEPRQRTGEINNILIFFGGTDPTGETIKALEAIKELNIPEINVVVGASNPKRFEIEKMCDKMPNTNFYCQVSNMAELMWKADLAIGAGGSTTWERCFLGLPTIVVITVDNQREVTNAVAKQGAIHCLGESHSIQKKEIEQAVFYMLSNLAELDNINLCCQSLLDKEQIEIYPVMKKILKL